VTEILLAIRDLSVDYKSRTTGILSHRARVRVLDHFNLDVFENETLGLVGESGSGKSTLVNCVLSLNPEAKGEVSFSGQNLMALRGSALRSQRREIQAVFQNPFSSLDPRMRVRDILLEPLRIHSTLAKSEWNNTLSSLMAEVGLSTEQLASFPHELSGGQAQRVAIARALALRPRFILLDEPTSALDVSVQAQVVNLLMDLQRRHGLTYLFVSHDVALVSHVSARIAVMYMGQIVELGTAADIVENPAHPYTRSLLSSASTVVASTDSRRVQSAGDVPSFVSPPAGCRFHTRCPFVMDRCRVQPPEVTPVSPQHWARCHLLTKDVDGIASQVIAKSETAT